MVDSTPGHSVVRYVHSERFLLLGTVVADIAKSRAEIESARLLVLSAALQASWFLTPVY